MFNFATFLAPMALLLPFAALQNDKSQDDPKLTAKPPTEQAQFPDDWMSLNDISEVPVQRQIRIERRVVIRISPYRPSRSSMNASSRRQRPQRKLVERKIGKCVPMQSIAAVRTTKDNRLLLYLKDQRLIAANLEKACSARDFYQGFYVEPSKDGNLCIKRDRLQSRTGVKCKMRRIRQLVPEAT